MLSVHQRILVTRILKERTRSMVKRGCSLPFYFGCCCLLRWILTRCCASCQGKEASRSCRKNQKITRVLKKFKNYTWAENQHSELRMSVMRTLPNFVTIFWQSNAIYHSKISTMPHFFVHFYHAAYQQCIHSIFIATAAVMPPHALTVNRFCINTCTPT